MLEEQIVKNLVFLVDDVHVTIPGRKLAQFDRLDWGGRIFFQSFERKILIILVQRLFLPHQQSTLQLS